MSGLRRRSQNRAKASEPVGRSGTRLRSELERQRRAGHRLELAGRVAVAVAGDLDKVASAMLASTLALAEELAHEDRLLSKLAELRQAGERAALLARQLLAVSEPAPQVAVVELGQVLERVSALLRPLLFDDIELSIVAGRQPCRSRVDLGQLEELVFGLLAACLDAMPDGGRLQLETSPLVVRAGEAAAAELPVGSYAVLSITRHSAGVDDAELPRTFEPGPSWAARRRGGALDEASLAELVAECGGYSTYENEPVRGKLNLYLPSTDEPAATSVHELAPVLPGGFETVLLVDESRTTRMSLRRMLKARGYRVIEAGNAEQALRASERHSGRIAALVTNVVLRGTNGYSLAERLRKDRPELKLLFMTSYLGQSDDGGIRLVGTEVVRIPFTAETLCKALRSLLDGGAEP